MGEGVLGLIAYSDIELQMLGLDKDHPCSRNNVLKTGVLPFEYNGKRYLLKKHKTKETDTLMNFLFGNCWMEEVN